MVTSTRLCTRTALFSVLPERRRAVHPGREEPKSPFVAGKLPPAGVPARTPPRPPHPRDRSSVREDTRLDTRPPGDAPHAGVCPPAGDRARCFVGISGEDHEDDGDHESHARCAQREDHTGSGCDAGRQFCAAMTTHRLTVSGQLCRTCRTHDDHLRYLSSGCWCRHLALPLLLRRERSAYDNGSHNV
jgi:hypothetical protein